MPKVTDITVLDIDGTPHAVESLTDEVKALVEVYNDWNRKEMDVRDELNRFHAARQTLSNQIMTKVREHLAEQAAAAADKESVEDEAASEITEADA